MKGNAIFSMALNLKKKAEHIYAFIAVTLGSNLDHDQGSSWKAGHGDVIELIMHRSCW